MGGLIFFYELKLLPYIEISALAWFYFISAFSAFLFGVLTITSAKNIFSNSQIFIKKENISLSIVMDNGKALKYSILFFSFIGIFVAIQRWYVLTNMFGSIAAVLVNAAVVYRLNVQGEIKDFIPILPAFVYVAVFLSGIYTAYKGKFSFISFLPFVGIVLKELTYFGRGEILFSLMEFLFSFFLFRHLLNNDLAQKFKFSKKNALIASTILLIFLMTSASFIRISRGNYENYVGASKELNQFKGNLIISPSIYLYLSSNIGVFSKYLEMDRENKKIGENSFEIVYIFLSKLGIIEKPVFYPRGYYIPMWTNSGTYLRELHVDFGFAGIFIGPYLIGLLITWFWFKFYEEKNLMAFTFLVYFYLIVGHSFLIMVTKFNQWFLSQFLIVLCLPFIEKIALRAKKQSLL